MQADSLFAGLGAFDSTSGVKYTDEDETGQRAMWVVDALKEGSTPETTKLPQTVLHWLLEDPLYMLSKHEPPAREWRREDLTWGPVPLQEGEEPRCSSADEPYEHTAVTIDRRLSYGRMAKYRLHRFVAKDPASLNDPILASQRVREREDGILATNFGGYHSQRDLFKTPEAAGVQQFILSALRSIERQDKAFWEADEEPPEVYNTPVEDAIEGWVNVSSAGDLNLLHHHSECTWSGVYYVDSGRGDVEGI